MDVKNTQLKENTFYHIYNKGIRGQNIFLEEKNYHFFLQKYALFVSPYVDTYAYCLMKNHFHLLIKTKSELEIRNMLQTKHINKNLNWILSNVLASLFKSFTLARNKLYNQSGSLFEEPFCRIEVNNRIYLNRLITYIHQNPQNHGFVTDFRDYPHSSYHSFICDKQTKLKKEEVISCFSNKENYILEHNTITDIRDLQELILEF